MKWFLAILMTLSLLTDGVSVLVSRCETERSCCCCAAPAGLPVSGCEATRTVVPSASMEKSVSRVFAHTKTMRQESAGNKIQFSRIAQSAALPTQNVQGFASFLSEKTSWHDFLRTWLT